MRPPQRDLAARLDARLLSYHEKVRPLPGIQAPDARLSFLEQILDSVHRVSYPLVLKSRKLSARRTDPEDELFDPLMAAIIRQGEGNLEEAFWLVFLFVLFGKSHKTGWQLTRAVYAGSGPRWDWTTTSGNPRAFREWLRANQGHLMSLGGTGNHRRYLSLDADYRAGVGEAVETYVAWVARRGLHSRLIERALVQAKGDRQAAFHALYRSLTSVASFGRLARFDYLCMLATLRLAEIAPGSTYLQGSTGPLKGARRLFAVNGGPSQLDAWLMELDGELRVGAQVLEDALCNWQKSPLAFKPVRV